MGPEQLAALCDAAEAADDPVLTIALVRALSDDEFAWQARELLEAAPGSRRVLSRFLARGHGVRSNEG